MGKPVLTDLVQTSLPGDQVKRVVDEYASFHAGTVERRKDNYTTMVNDFYDLVTDFYEFGWGQSFHFAPRHKGEAFDASIARHEFFLAHALQLKPGMTRTEVEAIIGSAFGAAGERCLAGSVLVPVGRAAEPLLKLLVERTKAMNVGDGSRPGVEMGPLITAEHAGRVATLPTTLCTRSRQPATRRIRSSCSPNFTA